MVTNEKQRKLNWRTTRCLIKTDKSRIDYRTLTKIGLSANIDGPCNGIAKDSRTGWMDDLRIYAIFNSITVISGQTGQWGVIIMEPRLHFQRKSTTGPLDQQTSALPTELRGSHLVQETRNAHRGSVYANYWNKKRFKPKAIYKPLTYLP